MGHDRHDQEQSYADLCRHLEAIPPAIAALERVLARTAVAGAMERIAFNGAKGNIRATDDKGPNALAIAIYNPNNFRVYVGRAGTSAAKDSFVVPKQKLVVAPLQVNGPLELLADEGDIGEGSGFVWRVRFETPQPFFVGALA